MYQPGARRQMEGDGRQTTNGKQAGCLCSCREIQEWWVFFAITHNSTLTVIIGRSTYAIICI